MAWSGRLAGSRKVPVVTPAHAFISSEIIKQRAADLHLPTVVIGSKLQQFRVALETKQAALEQVLRKRDGITVERSADASEEAQTALYRELKIRTLEQDTSLLLAIKVALRHIDEGTYGTCCNCDGEISEKRLTAIPWAVHCLECQEKLDFLCRREQEQIAVGAV